MSIDILENRGFFTGIRHVVLAGACYCALTMTALAQDVLGAMSAAQIEALMEKAGHEPHIYVDQETGGPVAIGHVEGVKFVLRALECDGVPLTCRRLLLFANFELGRNVMPSDYELVNRFNEGNADGRAYVIQPKRQIGVDYIIDLTGGVTSLHVDSRLGRWQGVIGDLIDEVRAKHTGS